MDGQDVGVMPSVELGCVGMGVVPYKKQRAGFHII